MKLQNKKVVVLAHGTFPESQQTLNILRNAPYIVCCDGAADSLLAFGITPTLIIGDGDSLSQSVKESDASRIISIRDQETNDLTKAVTYLISKEVEEITILGATGKREDHTLGNISLLLTYHKFCKKIKLVTEYGTFYPATNYFSCPTISKQQVSIFNFGCSTLKEKGLKYPIRGFKALWEGTLNEANADSIEISGNGDFIVYITHDIKA